MMLQRRKCRNRRLNFIFMTDALYAKNPSPPDAFERETRIFVTLTHFLLRCWSQYQFVSLTCLPCVILLRPFPTFFEQQIGPAVRDSYFSPLTLLIEFLHPTNRIFISLPQDPDRSRKLLTWPISLMSNCSRKRG